jgi:nucleoside-diphosphate-sugar epimerase
MSHLRTLIIGAGYIGEAFADFAHARGDTVVAGTASEISAQALGATKEYAVVDCDVSDRGAVEALRKARGEFDLVIFSASSGRGGPERYRSVYLEGAKNLAAVFADTHLIYTGSTSVYAQTDGGWVDESSPAEPDRETGKILRGTEEVVLAAGGTVARLAGIYGPGRSILLRRFLAGHAVLESDGGRWINQAHRDDIVHGLATLGQTRETSAATIYNVCDDRPTTQLECYTWLARHLGRELPPGAPPDYNRKRGWTNKRVSNARLRALGWAPRFSSFFDAVQAGLDPGQADAGGSPANST